MEGMEVAGEILGRGRVRVLKPCTMLLRHHDSRDPDPEGETAERYLTLQPGDEIVVIGPSAWTVELDPLEEQSHGLKGLVEER